MSERELPTPKPIAPMPPVEAPKESETVEVPLRLAINMANKMPHDDCDANLYRNRLQQYFPKLPTNGLPDDPNERFITLIEMMGRPIVMGSLAWQEIKKRLREVKDE